MYIREQHTRGKCNTHKNPDLGCSAASSATDASPTFVVVEAKRPCSPAEMPADVGPASNRALRGDPDTCSISSSMTTRSSTPCVLVRGTNSSRQCASSASAAAASQAPECMFSVRGSPKRYERSARQVACGRARWVQRTGTDSRVRIGSSSPDAQRRERATFVSRFRAPSAPADARGPHRTPATSRATLLRPGGVRWAIAWRARLYRGSVRFTSRAAQRDATKMNAVKRGRKLGMWELGPAHRHGRWGFEAPCPRSQSS